MKLDSQENLVGAIELSDEDLAGVVGAGDRRHRGFRRRFFFRDHDFFFPEDDNDFFFRHDDFFFRRRDRF
jgi:hypothetical protein